MKLFGKLYPLPTNAVAFKPKLRVTSFFTLLHKAQTWHKSVCSLWTTKGQKEGYITYIWFRVVLDYVTMEACGWLTKEWIEKLRQIELNENRKSEGWKMEGWGWQKKCFFDWRKLLERLTKCLNAVQVFMWEEECVTSPLREQMNLINSTKANIIITPLRALER